MTGRKARVTGTAAALLAAAVLLVSGCGSEGDGPEAAGGKTPAASGPQGAAKDPGPQDAVSEGPKLPEAELTPATGTFGTKEKEYLKDRVPKGVEPAAILEAGEEACRKIEAVAAVDKDSAREAIASGEIANAADAIEHLCPKFGDLL
ncbi:hypothetical protein ACFQLX_17995 [Streptomyces polyrhachis]|uniref:DUF732 domain-containing protein n=1 Tax=Streptomyces polyrhachis TaxID=1282885 RepID=A0ABW2GLN7_9ACTN